MALAMIHRKAGDRFALPSVHVAPSHPSAARDRANTYFDPYSQQRQQLPEGIS